MRHTLYQLFLFFQDELKVAYFFFTTGEHANNTETDGLDGEGRRPVLGQDGQTYMAIAIHMRVDWDVGAYKYNLQQTTCTHVQHITTETRHICNLRMERKGQIPQSS